MDRESSLRDAEGPALAGPSCMNRGMEVGLAALEHDPVVAHVVVRPGHCLAEAHTAGTVVVPLGGAVGIGKGGGREGEHRAYGAPNTAARPWL
jgi:hypothetical protein